MADNGPVASVVIIGGGPGGYEAALVGARLGAKVTIVSQTGLGGSAVLTDCVPSKALIATANAAGSAAASGELGITIAGRAPAGIGVDLGAVNRRILDLAAAQSADIAERLAGEGVEVVLGRGRLAGPSEVLVERASGGELRLAADVVLLATGARPRILPEAPPDGERILTWEQLYDLAELPERLIVVGSGVTGAEFAGAYSAMGSPVVLVSSRDRVLPGEDPQAAEVLEAVFRRSGMEVLSRSRAVRAERSGSGVLVHLEDGRTIEGTHALMAVGSVPNSDGLGLAEAGVATGPGGFITVDRVSRTGVPGVYAAGDCTGVLMLASVAAIQGRIAMAHALGDAVDPLDLSTVSSTVFTNPEIATVGLTQRELDGGEFRGEAMVLPLATNARAKMEGFQDGFIKVLCRRGSRIVAGAVVVSPHASELIHPLALAVEHRLTVDDLAAASTVYPSLTGSIAEAARRLHLGRE